MANRRRKILESAIERKCVEYAKAQGWKPKKLLGMFDMGWPDRMFLQPAAYHRANPGKEPCILFVEFKRPGEELTEKQKLVKKDLSQRGFSVHKIDNFEDFKRLLKANAS